MGEIRKLKSSRGGDPPRESTPRRLAAIVAGDIAGYSRLMQIDEEGTHLRVKRIERDLIEPSIVGHHGRLVKTTGDGFIAIFDSPVEAVRCGIVIQQNMVGRNASMPKHHWIEYRIGVNLGDVIIEADDVFGDGVNIATRLEGIADPGQVYISGGIYEQIKHKLVCGYESLGDRKVKNITDPVRVYRVLPDPAAFNRTRKRRENILIALLSLFLLVIASGVLWYVFWQPHGTVGGQASAPVSPETPKVVSPPPPTVKQAAPQTQPAPSVAPAAKQPSPQPQFAAPAAPATPSTSAVREPVMYMLRGGSFAMGSNDDPTEKPPHQVTIKPFAISQYPVTVREWNECAAAKACSFVASGNAEAPVTNVSWSDAKQFVAWLAGATRKAYRLPSEAEWEYAARAGTQTKYSFGDDPKDLGDYAWHTGNAAGNDPPVGAKKPNPWKLYDVHGYLWEWCSDDWHDNYESAPSDGSAWLSGGDPKRAVLRSGSWKDAANKHTSSYRRSADKDLRDDAVGLRCVLEEVK